MSYVAQFTVRVRADRNFSDKEIKAIADRLAQGAMLTRKFGSAMVWDATETLRSCWWGEDEKEQRNRQFLADVDAGDA